MISCLVQNSHILESGTEELGVLGKTSTSTIKGFGIKGFVYLDGRCIYQPISTD